MSVYRIIGPLASLCMSGLHGLCVYLDTKYSHSLEKKPLVCVFNIVFSSFYQVLFKTQVKLIVGSTVY